MTPRILAQLGALALAERDAICQDPDGKLKKKDGWSEHARHDLERPLTSAEKREVARLGVLASRFFYRAHAAGLRCSCQDCVLGDPALCRGQNVLTFDP